jgi:hypothetical protein
VASDDAGVLVVGDVPLRSDFPNGYASRYHAFVKELALHYRVDIVAIQHPESDWSPEGFLAEDVRPRRLWHVPVAAHPLNAPSRRAPVLRALHYGFARLPYMSYPRRVDKLTEIARELQPKLVIFLLPNLVHLWRSLPSPVPCVFVM